MGATIRVLHVDDDPAFCEVAAEFLEREDDRIEVRSEQRPEDALDLLAEDPERIDCVVSDYQMPEMDGIRFLAAIRQRHPDVLLPFILLTGKGSEAVAADALNAGASSYVKKGTTDVFEYVAERINHDIEAANAKRYRRRFDAVARALDDPVYVLDEAGRFTYVNEAFVDLTGYPRERIIGSGPSLIKTEASVAKGERNLSRLLSSDGPESVTFEIEIETSDGESVACEDHMGVLPYEGEEFVGSVGVLRDISDRKRRERELAAAKERYQLLVEQNLVGLYIARGGTVVYHNEPFGELFGYEAEQNVLAGERMAALFEPADRSRLTEGLDETEAGRTESIRQPFVGLTESGEEVNVELLARGIELDGESAVIGTVVDVGKDEEQYWKLRRERDRLEEFTSIVSHDLRSPLSVASGHLELAAAAEDLPQDAADAVGSARDALARMDALLDDLLELAKQGAVVDERETVDLRSAAESAWSNVATADAQLSVTATGSIRADPTRIGSVFENLLRNAIEHASPSVTVRVGDLEDGFYVADDGRGIPAEDREKVFESGFTTDEDGTGFGLSIVSEVVEAHGWTIEVTESESGGARFEIRSDEQAVRERSEEE